MNGNRSFLSTLVLLILLNAGLPPAEAVRLKYDFQVGATYRIEVKTSIVTDFKVFGKTKSTSIEDRKNFSATVLMLNNNLWVIDIGDENTRCRRFIKPDGTIVKSISDQRSEIPFFISLPKDEFLPGQTYTLSRMLPWGEEQIPATWLVKWDDSQHAKTASGSNKIIPLKYNGNVVFPPEKSKIRSLEISGMLLFDATSGLPASGTWTTEYKLKIDRKEMAIVRPLYSYREVRRVSFRVFSEDLKK